jgi:superfamily II DNA or RNA helicase/HKD family nuclease
MSVIAETQARIMPPLTKPTRSNGDATPFLPLEDVRPLYFLPADDLADEVLIPAFSCCTKAECMAGFFSSEALAALAPGLATYISSSSEPFRLIVSPFINEKDRAAIEAGLQSPADTAAEALSQMLITEDALKQHTLQCLSYLLSVGRLEMKIAVMEDALFHPKVWLFTDGAEVLAVHGSSNMTHPGIRKNFEQITISKSWTDPVQRYITEKLSYQFRRLWDNQEDHCIVLSAPQAINDQILRSFPRQGPPTEKDFRALYKKAAKQPDDREDSPTVTSFPSYDFKIPEKLNYQTGEFAHQGKAVKAWCDSAFRGILEMATGSGKTITAMICANKLFEKASPLLIVVAAPYVPLIEQWCSEIEPFGLRPHNLTTLPGAAARLRLLQQLKRRLRSKTSLAEVVVVSHDTLCTADFAKALADFDCPRLLIADEVHNLGRQSFIGDPPTFFEYRLGLSATPERQYDQDGTNALFDFFGQPVFAFTLEEAIGRCLVEYDYFLHPVTLSHAEMDDWYDLTAKIKANAWRLKEGKPDERLSMLLRDRRAILETAEGKITALAECLLKEDVRSLKFTLVYASDKAPRQLEEVNNLLKERGILFHQLTAEETSNRDLTKRVLRSFQEGEIQVLTAKRVLDEGVNIPQICRAFVLASTTVERQWIQRRGRLLRVCKEIGKTHSTIHDFLVFPPKTETPLDDDARKLISSELDRAQRFARLARNAGREDGPLRAIDRFVKAAYW